MYRPHGADPQAASLSMNNVESCYASHASECVFLIYIYICVYILDCLEKLPENIYEVVTGSASGSEVHVDVQ